MDRNERNESAYASLTETEKENLIGRCSKRNAKRLLPKLSV